jgi:hypothetical protein
MSFLPIIVITYIMYPIFAKLSLASDAGASDAGASDAGLKLAFEKSVNFLLFCGIPIATVMIVAAPSIIRFLYQRNEFAHSIPVLQLVAPGVVFAFISYALSSIILSKKQDSKLPIASAIALVFNLGLNLILILLYQHIGAAIASTLTEVLVCCIFLAFIPRYLLPFGSLRVALKALIASLVMALVILALHSLHIFVVLPIAMLVYVGVAVLIGVIPREDYLAVYRAIRQKAQPTSRPSPNDLPETPLPVSYADALLEIELATTLQLPVIRFHAVHLHKIELATTANLPIIRPQSLQPSAISLAGKPQPPYCADALLEDGLATTVKLPIVRRQPMQQLPLIQQGQKVPVSDENTSNKERFDNE